MYIIIRTTVLPLEEGRNNRTATTESYEGTVARRGQIWRDTKHDENFKYSVQRRSGELAGLQLDRRGKSKECRKARSSFMK